MRIGALAPLSPPGLEAAGRQLQAGIQVACEVINDAGGINGERLELDFADTAGDAARGRAAVGELKEAGCVAVVGEFHSVVAVAVADAVRAARLPFVCASATLDALTAERNPYVFRVAPAQTHGWRIYADFLLDAGCRHVAVAITSDVYWESGAAVLREHLTHGGASLTRLDASALSSDAVASRIESDRPSYDALLLLTAYPDPLASIVAAVGDRGVLVGDPAGRAAFRDWWSVVGEKGQEISFLAYLPRKPLTLEKQVAAAVRARLGEEATFVALEGYDALTVLSKALAAADPGIPDSLCRALRQVRVAGTRGLISFSTRGNSVVHQQWAWAPVLVIPASQRTYQEREILWGEP